ncbi:MAG: PBP1A family penicillin-binding protein [Clostridia bacterium]|nr:PBP1A family penicillin-binding protein [Clostridia bacterium]
MKKIDSIRSRQATRLAKREARKLRSRQSKRRRGIPYRIFVNFMKLFIIFLIIASIPVVRFAQDYLNSGNDFALDFKDFYHRAAKGIPMTPNGVDSESDLFVEIGSGMTLKLSSKIYYTDAEGNIVHYETLEASENRTWVSFDKVPQNLKDAFVAIEDQRFYEHNGVDIKRTLGAVINVFAKGDSSYGGSTITQQLVKNMTQDNERTTERKMREISRAIALEKVMTKDQILEMYMNDIYLSQGAYGVQAAAMTYFDKSVSDLTLAECACIAGITQYPTIYDPIINPKNNKEKQQTVLGKMLELGFITQAEYNSAIKEELVFATKSDDDTENPEEADNIQSYFTDYVIDQVLKDISNEYNCSQQMAELFLYNGGLEIYTTMDPVIQAYAEQYYNNPENFPGLGATEDAQSAIVIIDPSEGHIKAIVGGRGDKVDRGLNRASQSLRQPGSSIKPIAVYAPALEENVCNLSSYISNSKLTIGSWTPKNSNGKYTAPVKIDTAVAYSYNIPAINVLNALGVEKSFDYMKNKLHINSLVDSVTRNGNEYTDKNLSSLALGGLTDGITPLDMAAAYACLANGGMYIEPSSYTKITQNGVLLFEKKPIKERVFSEETAFLMQELLKNVVKFGTASGSVIGENDTCGKTGTTDNNKDKWFVGFTPSYCTAVWFGFDTPQSISTSSNPSVKIWRDVMKEIHKDIPAQKFEIPDGIEKAQICPYTGLYEGGYASVYANSKFLTGKCNGRNHKCIGANKNDYSSSDTPQKSPSSTPSSSKNDTPNESPSVDEPETTEPPSQTSPEEQTPTSPSTEEPPSHSEPEPAPSQPAPADPPASNPPSD